MSQKTIGSDTPFYNLLEIDYDTEVKKVGQKYYLVNDVKYERVTSMLKHLPHPQLEAWFKRATPKILKDTTARDRGTHVHTAIETALKEGVFNEKMWGANVVNRFNAFEQWKKYYDISFGPYVCEAMLYSHEWAIAGTVDFIGYVNGELTVIDWKTSKGIYESHAIQVATYMMMYHEITGEKPSKGLVVCLQDDNVMTQPIPSFQYAEETLFPAMASAINMYNNWKTVKSEPLQIDTIGVN